VRSRDEICSFHSHIAPLSWCALPSELLTPKPHEWEVTLSYLAFHVGTSVWSEQPAAMLVFPEKYIHDPTPHKTSNHASVAPCYFHLTSSHVNHRILEVYVVMLLIPSSIKVVNWCLYCRSLWSSRGIEGTHTHTHTVRQYCSEWIITEQPNEYIDPLDLCAVKYLVWTLRETRYKHSSLHEVV
jgi:hypothetical protein